MIYKLKNDKRGMTLIEMIISLVILSILMTSTMGMITSSMSIFTSTSQAALDRMVGSSVFTTLENTLKYSTHLTISDKILSEKKGQSFMLSVEDEGTKSGTLKYRGKDDNEYIELYSSSFYNNRRIQYSIKKAGSDQKHVRIKVDIYRENKVVYSKESVIKCINLALIKNGTNANTIKDESASIDCNQYIYFTLDEMLIAGGTSASTLEYKINEYMERYNTILAEYFTKMGEVNAPLNEKLDENKDESGYRILESVLDGLITTRDTAIFGDGTNSTSWGEEGGNYTTYKNLRLHYQNEINDLLKFTPSRAITDSGNPYYGVIANKEELYTGFLLNFYDENKDGKIVKSEYPQFDDPNTFFDGTTMKNYINENNGMAILAYFNDYEKDDYSDYFIKTNKTVYYYTQGNVKGYRNSSWVTNTPQYYNETVGAQYGQYAVKYPVTIDFYNTTRMTTVPGDPHYWRYNNDAVYNDPNSTIGPIGTYSIQSSDGSGFLKAATHKSHSASSDAFRSRLSSAGLYRGDITSYASLESDNYAYPGTDPYECTLRKFIAKNDIPDGWYYYKESYFGGTGNVESFHYFYLGSEGGDIEVTGNENNIAVYRGKTIELYSRNNQTESFSYEQAHYGETEGGALLNKVVARYDIKQHQYKDWILYGVDWNSWFKPSQDGFLNSIIGTIANWFNGQAAITEISGDSAEKVLGLKGKYNISDISTSARSYNIAWVVYSPRRGTWYYIPDNSNMISAALSKINWVSQKDNPVPLDIEGWSSSSVMVNNIESRKLTSSGFFGLINTTSDYVWVALPIGERIDPADVALTTEPSTVPDPGSIV